VRGGRGGEEEVEGKGGKNGEKERVWKRGSRKGRR
jgi:hypothetical protein